MTNAQNNLAEKFPAEAPEAEARPTIEISETDIQNEMAADEAEAEKAFFADEKARETAIIKLSEEDKRKLQGVSEERKSLLGWFKEKITSIRTGLKGDDLAEYQKGLKTVKTEDAKNSEKVVLTAEEKTKFREDAATALKKVKDENAENKQVWKEEAPKIAAEAEKIKQADKKAKELARAEKTAARKELKDYREALPKLKAKVAYEQRPDVAAAGEEAKASKATHPELPGVGDTIEPEEGSWESQNEGVNKILEQMSDDDIDAMVEDLDEVNKQTAAQLTENGLTNREIAAVLLQARESGKEFNQYVRDEVPDLLPEEATENVELDETTKAGLQRTAEAYTEANNLQAFKEFLFQTSDYRLTKEAVTKNKQMENFLKEAFTKETEGKGRFDLFLEAIPSEQEYAVFASANSRTKEYGGEGSAVTTAGGNISPEISPGAAPQETTSNIETAQTAEAKGGITDLAAIKKKDIHIQEKLGKIYVKKEALKTLGEEIDSLNDDASLNDLDPLIRAAQKTIEGDQGADEIIQGLIGRAIKDKKINLALNLIRADRRGGEKFQRKHLKSFVRAWEGANKQNFNVEKLPKGALGKQEKTLIKFALVDLQSDKSSMAKAA